MYGEQHLRDMVEIIRGLVEEAMPQACTYQDAQEAVEEHGFKLLITELLLSEETVHEQIHSQQSYAPAQRIPAYSQRTQFNGCGGGVPMNEELYHTLNRKCMISPSCTT